ncbi:defense protein 3-like [Epargyreus clarus]|uniref:defense protein 3-like n=1 Tax=Epargyreus clarus TaxID=520877 RepID=UPI003C2B36E0
MPVEGSSSQNQDKTMNYAISGVKEHGDLSVNAGAFANNYRNEPDKFNPNAPPYSAAGGSIGVAHAAGHAASLSAQHIPSFGNQVTAAANVNVLATDNHRVDANAFTTHSMPKGPMPAFQTHGGGVDYQFKETLKASATMSHTPMFNQTNYGVSTGVNLHRTPTSSLDFNVGANRTDTQFGRGQWQQNAFFGLKKQF